MTFGEHPALDVVVPVYDEEDSLRACALTLHATLTQQFPDLAWVITIADNASTDDTLVIAETLAAILPGVRVRRLAEKGRGQALGFAWLSSEADVVAYVDADLSTDLRAFPALVAPLLSGHSDVAIGSRLLPGSRIVRGAKREILSRGYNTLLHATLGVGFSDAQCGFKAMTSAAARAVLPYVRDRNWFFDTELLVIAERSGLRISEVAVDWVDDPQSSVDIAGTVSADLRGIARVAGSLARREIPTEEIYAELGRKPFGERRALLPQLVRFGVVGAASTALFTVLYLALAAFLPAQVADFSALAISAIANTAVNRRLTFGVRDRESFVRHMVQGLGVFAATWLLTASSLALAAQLSPGVDPWRDVVVVTAANAAATVLKFVALRRLFRPRSPRLVSTERTSRQELLEV